MPTLPLRCTIEGRDCDELVCDHRTGGHRHNVEQATNVSGALQAPVRPWSRDKQRSRAAWRNIVRACINCDRRQTARWTFPCARDDKTPAAGLLLHGNCQNFYRGPSRFLPQGLFARGIACLAFNCRGHDMREAAIPTSAQISSLSDVSPEIPTAPITTPPAFRIRTPPATGTIRPPLAAASEFKNVAIVRRVRARRIPYQAHRRLCRLQFQHEEYRISPRASVL